MRYVRTSAISKRHHLLLGLIREGRFSSSNLAESLGVSEPTVNRDIEFLREQGYRIKAVRVDRRWAYRLIDRMLVDSSSDAGGHER